MVDPTLLELRSATFAVSVLYDIDVVPHDDGIALPGTSVVHVEWGMVRTALAGLRPDSAEGREALAEWLRLRRLVADCHVSVLRAMARPVGLPRGHCLHPGPDWARTAVLGGVLDLGLGFAGLDPQRPDTVLVAEPSVLAAAGLTTHAVHWWPKTLAYLESMSTLAVGRWRRAPDVPLRPMGDCDVVTLLASRTLREAVCGTGGLRAVMVPMRTRGWVDLSRIDPAFGAAAAAATAPEDRGFDRPVLITADEVSPVGIGGRPAEIVLRDPAAPSPAMRDVLYH